MTEETTLKCQSCLDRQIPQTKDTVGLYEGNPICEDCLGALLDIKEAHHFENENVVIDKATLEARREKAIELLDELELVYDKWPLTREETLKCHEDFYNHRPPAIVNCSLAELEIIFARRKGILYAVRHKDERWSNEIDKLKRKAREEANLVGILKGKAEITKKITPSGESLKQKEKLAKKLGISLEKLLEIDREIAEEKFGKLVGQHKDANPVTLPPIIPAESTGSILKNLQKTVKNTSKAEISSKPKLNPFTGKPYA